ncbi:hypothetical protein [Pseudomonas fluorescens]|jgi:hypothetical protein|uniref:Uncharacterized protein n=1 Tax=Pseudomonas fluorescens TaxID=294 RepID=A0A5E7IH09_PSEFL|nr:hypothetical protein [Pseudomonas fluorescens]VVO74992.1 hypothetical protein PS880_01504 [Pseudomonas fluorescens]
MGIKAEKFDIRPVLTGDLKAISARISTNADEPAVVLIVDRATPEALDALGKSIEMLAHVFSQNMQKAGQETIDQIVSLFLPQVPVSSNLMREAQMLAKAKKAVLESGDWVTASDIAKLGEFTTNNPSSGPNKWKRHNRLFAIRHNGSDYFPVYGLDNDAAYRPLPAMREVINILATKKNSWGMAYWFASVSSLLGGKRPQDLLVTDPQRVIEAAMDEVAGITHG